MVFVFLETLEKNIDYRATSCVLELIWAAVGIWNMTVSDILNENNHVLRVWFLYYCYFGYWKCHQLGIRRGNFEMQIENLAIVSYNREKQLCWIISIFSWVNSPESWTEGITHLCEFSQFDKRRTLFCICEALELFDVKFIKQNITGKITDLENLTLQIRSVQSEHERMVMLFSEFVEDNTVTKGTHVTMQRKEVLYMVTCKWIGQGIWSSRS